MQVAAKRLLAGFVAEYGASCIGAKRPTDQGPEQQARLRYPPCAALCLHLVDAEQHERPNVDDNGAGDDIGRGEKGREGHESFYMVGGFWHL